MTRQVIYDPAPYYSDRILYENCQYIQTFILGNKWQEV